LCCYLHYRDTIVVFVIGIVRVTNSSRYLWAQTEAERDAWCGSAASSVVQQHNQLFIFSI
jgi:hypothetical protein